ncbi:MAG: MOSC N-terminal beta barrel domain-containing protein [Patescibacteria group bacterium]
MAKISALYKHPFKSLAGIMVNSMGFTSVGPNDDRRYMLVDAQGGFLSQRTHPQLALLGTELRQGDLVVTARNGGQVTLHEAEEPGAPMDVRIHTERCTGYYLPGDEADTFFSDLLHQMCCVVRYFPDTPRIRMGKRTGLPVRTRFTDGYPVTVMSARALWNLNVKLEEAGHKPVSARNFRPTIVVEDCDPHDEDQWLFAKANGITLRFEKHCDRCPVPNVDPTTGVLDERMSVTEALKKYRRIHADNKDGKVYFTSNFAVEISEAVSNPRLQVGDKLEIIYQEAKAA